MRRPHAPAQRLRALVRATAAAATAVTALLTTLVVPTAAHASTGPSWHLTVYYTAVESLHSGPKVIVTGCRVLSCSHGHARLGRFPRSFVRAVHDEGTGRITSGAHRGLYLEWSLDVGYWLDTVPRDSYGHRLRPFATAAADPSVLRRGSSFRVTRCGHDTGSGDRLDPGACAKLRAGTWHVADQFTPGYGGSHHVDLYIGEERGRHFEARSPLYLDASGAALSVTATAAPAAAKPTTKPKTSPSPTPTPTATAAAATPTPTPTATVTPTAPATTQPTGSVQPVPMLDDDFGSYPATAWQPGEPHGPWGVVWTGYGSVSPVAGAGLRLQPAVATAPAETHSALVTSSTPLGDVDVTWTYRTVSQLRTGSAPNPWEAGWVLWHYADGTHFYYVLLKPNGWELGKEDPAYPGAQRFLATGEGSFPIGQTYTVNVRQQGATISVSVDGAPLVVYTDTERPYLAGTIGLYDEDSTTDFSRVTARAL